MHYLSIIIYESIFEIIMKNRMPQLYKVDILGSQFLNHGLRHPGTIHVVGKNAIYKLGHAASREVDQCLSQDLETGCLKLAVVKFLGVQIFKGDHNILIFQP